MHGFRGSPTHMINRFSVVPLETISLILAAVAQGRQPPDYVITGARILSTYAQTMLEEREVWIKGGRIAAVKPAGSYPVLPGDRTKRYDARGGILAPGLIDADTKLFASTMSVCAYAEFALLNGTTTIICDCEEIARACDGRVANWFLADARHAAFSVFVKAPGASDGFAAADTARILDEWPEVVSLNAEQAGAPEYGTAMVHDASITKVRMGGRRVSYALREQEFFTVVAADGMGVVQGLDDDLFAEECLATGLWGLMRCGKNGFAGTNVEHVVRAIAEHYVSSKRICLCTGYGGGYDLIHAGLDKVVRQAVVAGVNPSEAWSMGSLHAAVLHGMDGEIGGIAPERRADLVLLNDDLEVQNTWYGGELVVEDRKIMAVLDKALSKRFQYPKATYNTVKMAQRSGLLPELPAQKTVANVMGVSATDGSVEHRTLVLDNGHGWSDLLAMHGLCFVTVLSRKVRSGRVGHGLLQGFGLGSGAVASSACRDVSSNIVAGCNEADMWLALTEVTEMDGGMCVVCAGRVLARLALPVGGILSDQRAADVICQREEFGRAWAEQGCTLSFEDFNRLTSRAQKEIRLTSEGLNLLPGLNSLPLFEAKLAAKV